MRMNVKKKMSVLAAGAVVAPMQGTIVKVLVEEGLDAREVECGVLQARDGGEPHTTLPGEVKVGADLDFYDYEAKYFGKGTVSIDVPAGLPDALLEEAREVEAIVERLERLEEDKQAVMTDMKEVFAEAKGEGYDVKVLRKVIRIRKQDKAKRQEEEAILDLYLSALGEV